MNEYKIMLRLLWEVGHIDRNQYESMYFSQDDSNIFMRTYDMTRFGVSEMHRAVEVLKMEAAFITKGELPNEKTHFKYAFPAQLMLLTHNNVLTHQEADRLEHSIDYDIDEWTDDEQSLINDILELYRIVLLETQPNIMEHIENPSFDLLMTINNTSSMVNP
jgi:hypothetical protein